MTIRIRPIAATDKERWLDLFKQYIIFYKSSLTDEQFELDWQRITSDFNINGLVAELDGQVVGLAHYIFRPSTWADKDFCYLEDLFVDPKVRGKGVGLARPAQGRSDKPKGTLSIGGREWRKPQWSILR
jgi:GNAT superfamily N-acetyltransferase